MKNGFTLALFALTMIKWPLEHGWFKDERGEHDCKILKTIPNTINLHIDIHNAHW